MKTAGVRELKKELANRSSKELIEICLQLAKFKNDNKGLLTYLLYEKEDEDSYIRSVQLEVENQFAEINSTSYYLIKKRVRKILRALKLNIRYSKKPTTEIELLLHFCQQLREVRPSYRNYSVLANLYHRQLNLVAKKIEKVHEDLQYEYQMELEKIRE